MGYKSVHIEEIKNGYVVGTTDDEKFVKTLEEAKREAKKFIDAI